MGNEPPARSGFQRALIGVGALLASELVGIPVLLAIDSQSGWSVVSAVLLGIAATSIVMRYLDAGDALIIGILAFVAVMFGFIAMSEGLRLVRGAHVHISARQAPAYPDATVFVLSDGKLRSDDTEWVAYSEMQSADMPDELVFYHATPVVPADWTPEQPVPLWAVCARDCGDGKGGRGGYAELDNVAKYREAVAKVERKHGIVSATNAPLIHWSNDPEQDAQGSVRAGFWAVGVIDALWLVWLLVAALQAWRQRARAASNG